MRSIWFFGCLVRDLSPQAGAGSGYALLEITAPPGSQPPPHIHHREDEGFYVLEGEMSVFTAAGGTTLRPGDHLTGPRGVAHTSRAGPRGVRKLVISAPGGFADFVREVGVPAARDELPPPEGPPEVGAITEAAARRGIEFVGPPGALP
jgi:mannose-6-phosphate isomerase-like protein (cupin superfamily)